MKRNIKNKKPIKYFKYQCSKGHLRIEPYKLADDPLPFCGQCHMATGELHRISYIGIGKYTRCGKY